MVQSCYVVVCVCGSGHREKIKRKRSRQLVNYTATQSPPVPVTGKQSAPVISYGEMLNYILLSLASVGLIGNSPMNEIHHLQKRNKNTQGGEVVVIDLLIVLNNY